LRRQIDRQTHSWTDAIKTSPAFTQHSWRAANQLRNKTQNTILTSALKKTK